MGEMAFIIENLDSETMPGRFEIASMNYSHKLPSSKAKLHSMDSEKMTKWLRVCR
jgi:hypothetical protein